MVQGTVNNQAVRGLGGVHGSKLQIHSASTVASYSGCSARSNGVDYTGMAASRGPRGLEQLFESTFQESISKSKNWEGQNLGTVSKQNGSIQIEKACIALRADRPLLNTEVSVSENSPEILKPVYFFQLGRQGRFKEKCLVSMIWSAFGIHNFLALSTGIVMVPGFAHLFFLTSKGLCARHWQNDHSRHPAAF
jgi:hypothetical protein